VVSMIEYLPDVLKDNRLFLAISQSVSPRFDECQEATDQLLNNQFILTADEDGIMRYEQLLGIRPKLTNTLDDRRFLVLSVFSSRLPYTYETLANELNHLCGTNGYNIVLEPNDYTIIVRVGLDKKQQYDVVEKLVRKRTPANIIVDLSLLYNSHIVLSSYPHGDLELRTYKQIKEDAF